MNWQGYLARAVEELGSSLERRHSPAAIPGVPEGATETSLVATFRELAAGWATALEAWPAVRAWLESADAPDQNT